MFYTVIIVFIVEYVTGFIKNATILSGLRKLLINTPKLGLFFAELFSCGYCLSVWVAITVVTILWPVSELVIMTGSSFTNYVISVILVAGLSNNWHGFKDRYLETYKDSRYIR